MNPSPRYAVGRLSALPAVNAQAVGSIGRASGLQLGSYKGPLDELVVSSLGSCGPVSRLHSLVIGRIISAVRAKKRRPSLTTPCNQLALALASRIENHNQLPGVPKKFLGEARDHPISASNRSTWAHILTEVVMILDPIEHFPELKKVRSAKGPKSVKHEEARFRSELLKFFNRALRNLLG